MWAVILADFGLEIAEFLWIDVELPFEITAHLSFHLIDLSEREHALTDYSPALVRVGIVADDLAGDHES